MPCAKPFAKIVPMAKLDILRWYWIASREKEQILQFPECVTTPLPSILWSLDSSHYGNTICGVFEGGIQNKKGFFGLKINCSQKKLLNFEN